MKCTNFYKLYEDVKRKELAELFLALKAHGGSFEFSEENCKKYNTHPPCIDGAGRNGRNEGTFRVTRVVLEGGVSISVYGISEESSDAEEEEEWIETLVRGAYHDIIELIPPTEEVQDVTISGQAIPIQWVSAEDLEMVGYATDIPYEQLELLAARMVDKMSLDDYWDALRNACEHYNLPKID